jgi:hypothetical protein
MLGLIVIKVPAEMTSITENQDNDLTKVTVDVFNKKHIDNYDIYLSENQVEKMDEIFYNIRDKLKNSNSYSDERKILSYAFKSFKELNLINYENDYSFLYKKVLNTQFNNHLLRNVFKRLNKDISPVNENLLCTIVARCNCTHFFRMFRWPILYNWSIGFNNAVCFGTYLFPNETNPNPSWTPAFGWINSNGFYGFVDWEDWFYGNISHNFYAGFTYYSVPGIRGFTGFKFQQGNGIIYFYGAATRVKLDKCVPPDP